MTGAAIMTHGFGKINESLDLWPGRFKGALMKNKVLLAAPVAALFILGGCGSGATNNEAANATAEVNKAEAKAAMPMIKSAHSFRCKDNSVVHITLMTDEVTAMVRDAPGGAPKATLTAPAAGEAYVADGYSLTVNGETATYKSPTTSSQTCRS